MMPTQILVTVHGLHLLVAQSENIYFVVEMSIWLDLIISNISMPKMRPSKGFLGTGE